MSRLAFLSVAAVLASCALSEEALHPRSEPVAKPDPALMAQRDELNHRVHDASRVGLKCAPEDLGVAESNVDFAAMEIERGNNQRARQHLDIATLALNRAMQRSVTCPDARPDQ